MEPKTKRTPAKRTPAKKTPAKKTQAKETRLLPLTEVKDDPVKPQATKPRLLPLNQAAALIDGLSRHRLRELCISGEIKSYKFGRKYMISEREILRYFDEIA